MSSSAQTAKDRARYWRNVMIKYLCEHPAGSLRELTASLADELARLLQAEIDAGKRRAR